MTGDVRIYFFLIYHLWQMKSTKSFVLLYHMVSAAYCLFNLNLLEYLITWSL